jgi:hypothetical protein
MVVKEALKYTVFPPSMCPPSGLSLAADFLSIKEGRSRLKESDLRGVGKMKV